MPEFRILTDEELKNIYEVAQERANEGLKYAYDRQKEAQFNEEKSYDEAMKKYESDMAIYKQKYEEKYQQFLKSEETQKKIHEEMQNSKIKAWEDMKIRKEMQGQAVDESTRPQKQPYPSKAFHYNVPLPQKPIMKVHPKIKFNCYSDIISSFQVYSNATNSSSANNKKIFGIFTVPCPGISNTSDFYRSELRKEEIINDQNKSKLKYLTLREHF